jgi:hypothetical protein
MIIDVSVIHNGHHISIKSKAINFSEVKPATIGLSKVQDEEGELIEGVGESWTTADLKHLASIERGNNNRIYRVINPFSADSFEVSPAFMAVRFYCLKLHALKRPKTYQWCALLKLDIFDLTLELPNYNLIGAEKRISFEKELCKITKRFKINP